MSNVKVYRRFVEEAVLALEMLSHGGEWESYGLPEVLTHLRSVALDLKKGEVTRALGQHPYVNDEFERFAWAVKGFSIGPKVQSLYVRFVEAGIAQGGIQLPRKHGAYIRPEVGSDQ